MNQVEVWLPRPVPADLQHSLDKFMALALGNNLHTLEAGLQALCQGKEFNQGFYLPSGDGFRLEVDEDLNLLLDGYQIAYGGAFTDPWAGAYVVWHCVVWHEPNDGSTEYESSTKVPSWYPVLREYMLYKGWRQRGLQKDMVDTGPAPDIWVPPVSVCQTCEKYMACSLVGTC